ncbi:LytR/AlgR family response regulator transcription factor [Herbidospora mongoliensis]|uniref:LytR/AlgR family response regulator transcription factor n=1 Tax=Herbidospora mongoliensis TaxID=688067 RepID=UPI000AADF293|nr:LytTR family DNA-binding domain-containing protein [Herbidospora mongoliensis]
MCCFDLPFRLTPEAARAALPHLEKAVGAPMTITSTTAVLAGSPEGWEAAMAAMRGRPSPSAVPLTITGMVVGALVAHGPARDLRKAARHLSDQLELDHLRRKVAQESIPVELGGRTRFIDPGAVWFAEAHGDYVRLRTSEGGFLVRISMAALERRWAGAGFIRAHRSTLVNARHVTELRFADGRALLLVGTETLPVSRRHTREVRERLTARRA